MLSAEPELVLGLPARPLWGGISATEPSGGRILARRDRLGNAL